MQSFIALFVSSCESLGYQTSPINKQINKIAHLSYGPQGERLKGGFF